MISLVITTPLAKKKIVDRTKEFVKDEIEEIKKYKWIQSEKAHHDLGEKCCNEWIHRYAAAYRHNWEKIHGKIIQEIEVEDERINCESGSGIPA